MNSWSTKFAELIELSAIYILLNGCTVTPITLTRAFDGTELIEHIDDKLPPACEQAYPRGGCYQARDGKHHIWYSSVSMPYVREHEIAHAKGMRHTEWEWIGQESCATILVGVEKYLHGRQLCIGQRGEYISSFQ